MDESIAWLTWLYGTEPPGLIWIGGQQDNFVGRTFTSVKEAVAYAETFVSGGVYHRLTTLRAIERGRGTAGDSAYLPGFAMDLDLRGPGHKALNYPETDADLEELLRKAGLPEPSAWVNSGGGRYPFWKLEQPADLTIPGALELAAGISARLHRHVIAWAGELGWKVDNTSDLARVYRLPGTLNRKTEPYVMCTVRNFSEVTYSLETIGQAVEAAGLPVPLNDQPQGSDSPGMPDGGSQLFAPERSFGGAHAFTREQAIAYVQPALADLEKAQDGGINSALLKAALMMAHFGPEFWSRDLAEEYLIKALSHTVWDDATWKAADTIARAYADMANKPGAAYWSATRTDSAVDSPATEPGRLRRHLMTRGQVHELADPVPLIEDVLYRESIVVLSGKFGTYKSFIAVSWAASLASGTEWFGHRVPAKVPVIYAAAEGAYGIRKRLNAWEKKHGVTIPDDLYLISVSVRINRPGDVQELEEIIRETGAQVLIFDTLHMSTPGVDENDSGEMGQIMDVLRGLQQRYGLTSILPHHTGHAGERARGSSSVEDDADTSFVVRIEGEDRSPANKRTLVHRKTKDAALIDPVELMLDLQDGTGSAVVRPMNAFEKAVVRPDGSGWAWPVGPDGKELPVQRMVQQMMSEAEFARGITKSEAEGILLEKIFGKVKARLPRQRWHKGWDRAIEYGWIANVGGERFSADPVTIEAYLTSQEKAAEDDK